MHHEIQNV